MHTEIKKWEERFDEIVKNTKYTRYSVGDRFCCGGDYCETGHNEWIKSFIAETIEGVRKQEKEKVRSIINKFTYDEDKLAELVTYLGSSPTEKK